MSLVSFPPSLSIFHSDLFLKAQDWATTDLIANGGNQAITIPTCIEDGQYLLRAELIALHAASATLGAQFYVSISEIKTTFSLTFD